MSTHNTLCSRQLFQFVKNIYYLQTWRAPVTLNANLWLRQKLLDSEQTPGVIVQISAALADHQEEMEMF